MFTDIEAGNILRDMLFTYLSEKFNRVYFDIYLRNICSPLICSYFRYKMNSYTHFHSYFNIIILLAQINKIADNIDF